MPFYRVQTNKEYQSEKFCNDYIVEAANFGEAIAFGQDFIALERILTSTLVLFTNVLASTEAPDGRVFVTQPVNLFGLRPIPVEQLLPGFNTLRVDLGVGVGDGGRKYYRFTILEGEQSGGMLTPVAQTDAQSTINTWMSSHAAAVESIKVGPDRNTVFGFIVYPKVQMRQLHRRRRKKVVPA